MNSLLFLSNEDFSLEKGTRGPIMCNSIPGLSLVLFYSTHCKHCKDVIPIFKRLPKQLSGCQFGIINVSNNNECVIMSRKSIAPIKYVPYILLFVNGKPFMRYQGKNNEQDIKNFVIDISKKIASKQKFVSENIKENVRTGIPDYSIGVPLCGEDDVCYLEFDEAYVKK